MANNRKKKSKQPTNPTPTACKDCRHMLPKYRIVNAVDKDEIDYQCAAKLRPITFNAITGQNELGEYPLCKDVNDGKCELFERK